jgi:hypothetical protein
MFTSMGPTSRFPVVAGLSVSGGSAQPIVRVAPLDDPLAEFDPPDEEQAAPMSAAAATATIADIFLSLTSLLTSV